MLKFNHHQIKKILRSFFKAYKIYFKEIVNTQLIKHDYKSLVKPEKSFLYEKTQNVLGIEVKTSILNLNDL